MNIRILLCALALAGGVTVPPAAAGLKRAEPDFCTAMQKLVAAASEGFEPIRAARSSALFPDGSSVSSVSLPGAVDSCTIAPAPETAKPRLTCYLTKSLAEAAAQAEFVTITSNVKGCLPGVTPGGFPNGTEHGHSRWQTWEASSTSTVAVWLASFGGESYRVWLNVDATASKPLGATPAPTSSAGPSSGFEKMLEDVGTTTSGWKPPASAKDFCSAFTAWIEAAPSFDTIKHPGSRPDDPEGSGGMFGSASRYKASSWLPTPGMPDASCLVTTSVRCTLQVPYDNKNAGALHADLLAKAESCVAGSKRDQRVADTAKQHWVTILRWPSGKAWVHLETYVKSSGDIDRSLSVNPESR